MDRGWKRVYLLLIFLIFWKHDVDCGRLRSQHAQPHTFSFHEMTSPQGAPSYMSVASGTEAIPLKVDFNVFAERNLSPSRSLSYSKFAKGGASISYNSMSQTQGASGVSLSASSALPDSISTLQLQGSTVQDLSSQSASGPASYSQYASSPNNAGGFAGLVSTPEKSGLSQSGFSQSSLGSLSDNLSPSTVSQSSAVSWPQGVQTSGTAALQSASSPETSQTPSRLSFLPAFSAPVGSAAQSGQASVSQPSSSLLGFGSRHSPVAASGSAVGQMSPGLSVSRKWPIGLSSGSPVQAAAAGTFPALSQPLDASVSYGASVGGQGMSSGSMVSGLTSGISSSYGSYGQNAPVSTNPSWGSSGNKRFNTASSMSSGLQLGGMSSQGTSSYSGSSRLFGTSSQLATGSSSGRLSTHSKSRQALQRQYASAQGTSRPQLTGSSSMHQVVSAPGGGFGVLSPQPQRSSGQYSPVYSSLGSSPVAVSSSSTSGKLSQSQYASTQGISRPQLTGSTGSSSLLVSAPGAGVSFGVLSPQPQRSSGQYSPVYSSLGSSPVAVSSSSTSGKPSQGLYASGSLGGSSQLATPYTSGLAQGVSSLPGGSYVQSQGSPSQFLSGPQFSSALASSPTTSRQYSQAVASSPPLYQGPQKLQSSSSSSSLGSQASGAALSQSGFSLPSAPAPSKPLSSVGLSSQSAPGYMYPSASMASPQSASGQYVSMYTLSQSQKLQRQSSAPLPSRGIQSSGTVLQSSSPPQPAKAPSMFSLSSAGGASSLYTPGSTDYAKVSSPLGVASQFTSGLGSQSLYTSSSQSIAGSAPAASSHYAPAQGGTRFGLSTTAMKQSSFSPQNVQTSSVAGSASQLLSMQGGGSYSGLSPSLSSVRQHTPGSPAYAKFGSSPLGVSSQPVSGQGSSSQYTSLSQSGTVGQLTSSGILSAQGGRMPVSKAQAVTSGFSLSQGQSSPSWQPSAVSLPQGVQTSVTAALQSASSPQSSQTSSSLSFLPALSAPVGSAVQSGQASVSQPSSSLLGSGSRHSSVAASGSAVGQMSPGLSVSPKWPIGLSSGSPVQAAGMFSALSQPLDASASYGASVGGQDLSSGSSMSSGLTSGISSSYGSYGQNAPVSTNPSRGSSSRYGVKG